jgi:hypothetical protein
MNDLVLEETRKLARPFPTAHGECDMALIHAAIAEAAAEPGTVVDTRGILHHVGGAHYAVFGRVAYTLRCEVTSDSGGWSWEMMPAVVDQHLIGRWPHEEAGTILHLQRFLWIDGDFVIGPRWEAVWVACEWQACAEVGFGRGAGSALVQAQRAFLIESGPADGMRSTCDIREGMARCAPADNLVIALEGPGGSSGRP